MYLGQFCSGWSGQFVLRRRTETRTHAAGLVDLEIHLQPISLPIDPRSFARKLVPPPRSELDAYASYAHSLLAASLIEDILSDWIAFPRDGANGEDVVGWGRNESRLSFLADEQARPDAAVGGASREGEERDVARVEGALYTRLARLWGLL